MLHSEEANDFEQLVVADFLIQAWQEVRVSRMTHFCLSNETKCVNLLSK